MSSNLIERLDAELKVPIKKMINQSPRLSLDDIPAARAMSKKMMDSMKMQMPVFHNVKTVDKVIPGTQSSPNIIVRIYRPAKLTTPLPALLWIHGGGYVFGDIDQADLQCKQLAVAGECVVVSVDYRLAPEHPYPAPLEDCYSALKWLAINAYKLRVDRSRIAIGGASAGGGLAAGLALLTRDRAEVSIIFQFLIYPMINDCNIELASDTKPDTIIWTRKDNLIGWRSYLGCEPGTEGIPCYAAASRATDLKGLPATYITVGDLDLFAQEDVDYARKLIEAGVSTEFHLYPGCCHAFDEFVPGSDVAKRFSADMHRALKRALHS